MSANTEKLIEEAADKLSIVRRAYALDVLRSLVDGVRSDIQERFERYSEESDEAHSATVGILLEDGVIQRLLSESAEGTRG